MTLEKSSIIQVTQSEYFSIKNGSIPEKLEATGYTLEDLQAKLLANEVEVVKAEPKKASLEDVNTAQ